jgi:hypothetical protein
MILNFLQRVSRFQFLVLMINILLSTIEIVLVLTKEFILLKKKQLFSWMRVYMATIVIQDFIHL